MKRIIGTEKQIKLAENIRNCMLNETIDVNGNVIRTTIDSEIDRTDKSIIHYANKIESGKGTDRTNGFLNTAKLANNSLIELREKIMNETSAVWFIENREFNYIFIATGKNLRF